MVLLHLAVGSAQLLLLLLNQSKLLLQDVLGGASLVKMGIEAMLLLGVQGR